MKAIAPETVAQIRALRAGGYEVSEIVERVPVSEMTVRRYLGMVETEPRPNEAMNPLFDPYRDGVPDQSVTARLSGDPRPGRRELVDANRAREHAWRGKHRDAY